MCTCYTIMFIVMDHLSASNLNMDIFARDKENLHTNWWLNVTRRNAENRRFPRVFKGLLKPLTCSCQWFAAASCVAWRGGCKLRRSSSGSGPAPPSSSWLAALLQPLAPYLLEGRLSGLASCDLSLHHDWSDGQNAHPCCHSDHHNDPWAEQREEGKVKKTYY